jgi:hypothetical protein
MGSSIFSAAIGPVSREFGVINEVGTLGTSLFVFGYAFGPLVRSYLALRKNWLGSILYLEHQLTSW